MRTIECHRERDALDALRTGRWDEELREHVDTCSICADVVDVAGVLLDDRRAAMRDARVPASGLVWWRMQRRARQEATRTAARTMTIVQAAALACALIVTLLLLRGAGWNGWLPSFTTMSAILGGWGMPLILAFAAWLTLTPVALYLALTEES